MVKKTFNDFDRAHLTKIVRDHHPSQLTLVDKIGIDHLTEDEREALREVVADELTLVGLDPDGEPNSKGLELEALIDKLSHV